MFYSLNYVNYLNEMKKVLAFKPLCIRLQSEESTKNKDCPEAIASLASVETAEFLTEAVLQKTRDARSAENIIMDKKSFLDFIVQILIN